MNKNIDQRYILTEEEQKEQEMIYLQLKPGQIGSPYICGKIVYPPIPQLQPDGTWSIPEWYSFPIEYKPYIEKKFGDRVIIKTKKEMENFQQNATELRIKNFVEQDDQYFINELKDIKSVDFLTDCLKYSTKRNYKMKNKLIQQRIEDLTTEAENNKSKKPVYHNNIGFTG